jgi:hypothetical protein
MNADDLYPCHLHCKQLALAFHREYTRIIGRAFLREHRSAPVNGIFIDWEQDIIHGQSTAVVLHLLNRELADFEDGIAGKLSRRKILAAER